MNPSSAQDPLARVRNLVWFRSPGLWQIWPFLPVIRPSPDGQGCQCGVLYDARHAAGVYGYSATVFLANVFLIPRSPEAILALPKLVYDTPEEVADAGWSVD